MDPNNDLILDGLPSETKFPLKEYLKAELGSLHEQFAKLKESMGALESVADYGEDLKKLTELFKPYEETENDNQ